MKNTKEDEVKIEVSEQVPLSTDDRIKVQCHVYTCTYSIVVYDNNYIMRDEKEGRKKEASKVKQTTTTQHTQDSHFS